MEPIYRLNPDLAWRVIDTEVVILKIKTTTYYSLDPVGSFIWRALEPDPLSKLQLVERVTKEYDVAPASALTDIDELFADLVREELLLEEAA